MVKRKLQTDDNNVSTSMNNKKRKLVLWYPEPYAFGGKISNASVLPFAPLGLGVIAALTPDHWDVVIRDANYDQIQYEDCDLVGITAMTCQILNAYEIAKIFRERGVQTVLGGIHGTFRTEEALNCVDTVVRGEAELLWPQVIKDFENGEMKRIYETSLFHDLNNLPKPARHLFNPKYNMALVQRTRGCPFKCEYCSVCAYNGGKYRKRPIAEVLDEIEQIPQDIIFFADDNAYGFSKEDRQEFIDFCQGMIDRKINKNWHAQVPVTMADDEEALKIASAAGCKLLLMGVESANNEVLTGNMNKKINVKYLEQGNFTKRLHQHGIALMSFFLIGNDEENIESFKYTYMMMKKWKIDVTMGVRVLPFPGTKLYERLEKENRLYFTNYPEDWKYFEGLRIPLYKMKQMDNKEYLKKMIWINNRILSIGAILHRAIRTFMYSRDLVLAIIILVMNLNFRKRELTLWKGAYAMELKKLNTES